MNHLFMLSWACAHAEYTLGVAVIVMRCKTTPWILKVGGINFKAFLMWAVNTRGRRIINKYSKRRVSCFISNLPVLKHIPTTKTQKCARSSSLTALDTDLSAFIQPWRVLRACEGVRARSIKYFTFTPMSPQPPCYRLTRHPESVSACVCGGKTEGEGEEEAQPKFYKVGLCHSWLRIVPNRW